MQLRAQVLTGCCGAAFAFAVGYFVLGVDVPTTTAAIGPDPMLQTVNRGAKQGLDTGSVLELYHYGRTIPDRGAGNEPVKLPDEKYGALFIFRTFNNVSYGLVMQVTDPVQVGDIARSPE